VNKLKAVKELVTKTPEETQEIAEKIGEMVEAGNVITLQGDLGTGKTTFTKGLANGLDVKRNVNSPTFTIMKQYQGRIPLYHMDVYRLEDSDEDIGFSEYFDGDGVAVVEWADFIEEYLPEERLEIRLSYLGESSRKLELRAIGSQYVTILEAIND
jgi:tRNA threonylcarbamoyladenosine biosynthesis protein TsaE